jgi:hypothetical protein
LGQTIPVATFVIRPTLTRIKMVDCALYDVKTCRFLDFFELKGPLSGTHRDSGPRQTGLRWLVFVIEFFCRLQFAAGLNELDGPR